MGIFSALFAGVNGINSNGNVISVIGDNISNVNTVGFKSSRAEFEDILAGGGIGLGSRVSNVSNDFGQGGFESTSSVTDLAIDGEGFFVVKNPDDGSTSYSRAGQFTLDKQGYVVNSDGLRLQGFTVENGQVTSNISEIQLSSTPTSPAATGNVDTVINLNSNETSPAAFDTTSPVTTSNFSAGITVYDSIGNDHLVTVYFRKSGTNAWEWHALVDGGDVTTPSTGVNVEEAAGTLLFNTSGALLSSTVTTNDFDFLGATQDQSIMFDFGTSIADSGTGLTGVTQFGSANSITNIAQDGYASGALKSIDISSEGLISGNYTNGTTLELGQIVVASFNNEVGLQRVGGNRYIETLESGEAIVGTPGSSGKGTIVSSTLEQSNVDLAAELIKMVIIQRGFQANSRTISTVNDLLAQLVTLGS